ncbi:MULTISPECIES: hypothetical protein [Streptomyces]|uniref:hypothetical protein n=1 Tax=Streptomyces TaxID=1883 RepID=UPI00131C5556|nr:MULTISPECIES: hypothetical protein [Streptomyces]
MARLIAAGLMMAAAVIGPAGLAAAEPADEVPTTSSPSGDVGWGSGPADTPQPTQPRAADVGWG